MPNIPKKSKKVTDKEIEERIDEFAELSDKIVRVENELNKLKNKYSEVEDELRPYVEAVSDAKKVALETKKHIVWIARKAGIRRNYSYKTAFNWLLGKVNKHLQRIATEVLASTMSVSKISSRLAVVDKDDTKDEISESYVGDLIKKFGQKLNGLVGSLTYDINKLKLFQKAFVLLRKKLS